ncbi:group II intron reverse transcriptase domain-containing protein [Candidatus Woesearchaeota archaeon]|nr:hypothetical protein [uncultured archaeon]AQS33866.1 hypothetical protein [uncultured archaeon]MBS3124896.1 group II intron reverse transcriptase domain-containing protein [Candidatus Woesearchaeota archaeon]
MKRHSQLFKEICTWKNLEDSYWKARKHKSNNPRIQEFEKHWQLHLLALLKELRDKIYTPQPLRKFILRDPKTRLICVSEFRDRIIHHAIVNALQPIFQPRFIHDSYASQKGKGTLPALDRLKKFMCKVSKNGKLVLNAENNNAIEGFALKADIQHYFDTVDHIILLELIEKKIKDKELIWLVQKVLDNYNSGTLGKGMPLGNWTSQFFANIYLNELDQFVKHVLKAKYYIRYVDDFIILRQSKVQLQEYRQQIQTFLKKLKLTLHPNKCKITPLSEGVSFLGFRIFFHYKIVRPRNFRKIKAKLLGLLDAYEQENIDASQIIEILRGWNGYAANGNTYTLRQKLTSTLHKELLTRRPPSKRTRCLKKINYQNGTLSSCTPFQLQHTNLPTAICTLTFFDIVCVKWEHASSASHSYHYFKFVSVPDKKHIVLRIEEN